MLLFFSSSIYYVKKIKILTKAFILKDKIIVFCFCFFKCLSESISYAVFLLYVTNKLAKI